MLKLNKSYWLKRWRPQILPKTINVRETSVSSEQSLNKFSIHKVGFGYYGAKFWVYLHGFTFRFVLILFEEWAKGQIYEIVWLLTMRTYETRWSKIRAFILNISLAGKSSLSKCLVFNLFTVNLALDQFVTYTWTLTGVNAQINVLQIKSFVAQSKVDQIEIKLEIFL